VTAVVTMDTPGVHMHGVARYLDELRGRLARTGREDAEIIGSLRRVESSGLLRHELSIKARWRAEAPGGTGRSHE
jgi:hypothetical protein